MLHEKALRAVAFVISSLAMCPTVTTAQPAGGQSCAESLTQQLRRFSEKCIADVIEFVASQAKMSAKIYSEAEKYYVSITRDGDGLLAEAVSKFNYPLMKADTPELLKQLGWAPPENEADNWKKKISSDAIKSGAAAQELSKALTAYGLKQGEAISLTVGPQVSG